MSLEPCMEVFSQTSIETSYWQHSILIHRKYMKSASLFNISRCFFQTYSQVTFTWTVRFSGSPKPLDAVQVNVPASVLLMFVIVSTFPFCATLVFPWFPGFSLVQVMFGPTRLNASQINCKLSPSRTVGSPLIPVIFIGTKSNQTITSNLQG